MADVYLRAAGGQYRVGTWWFHSGGWHETPAGGGRGTRCRVFVPADYEQRGEYLILPLAASARADAARPTLYDELKRAIRVTRGELAPGALFPWPERSHAVGQEPHAPRRTRGADA